MPLVISGINGRCFRGRAESFSSRAKRAEPPHQTSIKRASVDCCRHTTEIQAQLHRWMTEAKLTVGKIVEYPMLSIQSVCE